jgi:hypothetical protein
MHVPSVPQDHTENMGREVFRIFPGLVSWKLRSFVKGLGPTSGFISPLLISPLLFFLVIIDLESHI